MTRPPARRSERAAEIAGYALAWLVVIASVVLVVIGAATVLGWISR